MRPTIAPPRTGGDVQEARPVGGPVLKAWGWPVRTVLSDNGPDQTRENARIAGVAGLAFCDVSQ